MTPHAEAREAHPEARAGEPEVVQEAERVRTGVIWLIAAGVIAISALLIVIAWWLVVPPASAQATAPSTLEHGLFDQATGGQDARAAGEARLERYEWIDRGTRVVHIPIERAIDAVVANPALIRAGAAAVSSAGSAAGLGEVGR